MTQLYLTVNLKLKNVIVIVMILLPFVANGLFLNGKSFGNNSYASIAANIISQR